MIDLQQIKLPFNGVEKILLLINNDIEFKGKQLYIDSQVTLNIQKLEKGWSFQLNGNSKVEAPCDRCLEKTIHQLILREREVHYPRSIDENFLSDYVQEGFLDEKRWIKDATILALPEKWICSSFCQGICQDCGIVLNDVNVENHLKKHQNKPNNPFQELDKLR